MFEQYMKSEQRKFLYNKWILIVMTGMLILIPSMALSLDAFWGEDGYLLIKSKLMQSFYLGQVGYVVLSALYFGQEYVKCSLRTSLLSTPRRRLFLLSKVCCMLMWTMFLLTTTSLLSIAIVHLSFNVSLTPLHLGGLAVPKFSVESLEKNTDSDSFIATVNYYTYDCETETDSATEYTARYTLTPNAESAYGFVITNMVGEKVAVATEE